MKTAQKKTFFLILGLASLGILSACAKPVFSAPELAPSTVPPFEGWLMVTDTPLPATPVATAAMTETAIPTPVLPSATPLTYAMDTDPVPIAQGLFQKGMTYTTWPVGKFGTPDAGLALTNLKATGANWIALIVTQYQDDLDTIAIFPTAETPTDAEVAQAINQAHALGLKIMLKIQLDPLVTTATHWRGMIGQDFTGTQWNEWFVSYTAYVTHYAALAQANGVEQYCIGVELSTSAQHAVEWRKIVAIVRALFHGSITYAALNRFELTTMTWWDALDYIGVDMYNGLVDHNDPTDAELQAAWAPTVDIITKLAKTWNKSVLITEIGYMSQDGNLQHPWNWLLEDGIIDLQEQADGYQAAFEVLYHQPWLSGIYWWDYGTDPYEGGPCDQRYTPHDKPAEDVLRLWYGAPASTAPFNSPSKAAQTLDIYTDSLSTGWEGQLMDIQADFLSTAPVFSGTHAISVSAQPQGVLSLQHQALDLSPYYWLDFYVMKPAIGEETRVFITDDSSTELRRLPLCRYMTGEIKALNWNRVLIPLADLNAQGRTLQKISFVNVTSQPRSFWLDEIRLVAPAGQVYLPYIK
jgi:hypothetical protein